MPTSAETLDAVARMVAATCGVSAVLVTLLDPASGELVTRARAGFDASAGGAGAVRSSSADQVGEEIAGQVATSLTPLVLSGADPRLRALLPGSGPAATAVCVPLVEADHLLGTLLLASPDGRAREVASQPSFPPLSALVATTLGMMQRVEGAAASAHVNARLLNVARSLNSSLDPALAYAAAITGIRRLVACERVALLVRDATPTSPADSLPPGARALPPTRRDVRLASLWSAAADAHDGLDELDERAWCLVEWVLAQRRPRALLPGEATDTEDATTGDSAALYCVPLGGDTSERGDVSGAILVARAQPFSVGEIRVLAHVSHIVAAAIANSQAHQAARIQHEKLATIFASASEGLAIADSALRLIEVNTAFARLLNRPRAAIAGVRLCETLGGTPESGCALCGGACMLRHVIETGEPRSHVACELGEHDSHSGPLAGSYSRPVSKTRAAEFTLSPIAGPDGRGVLLIGRDTTAARDAERMRDDFLSVLSHELRQPLQHITGWLGIALDEASAKRGTSESQQATFLRRAFIASEHLTALVNDLLLLSNRDAGTFSLQPRMQDLEPLLRSAVEEMEIRAKQEGVRLRLDVPHDLPPIAVDGLRFGQVLRNLIVNAIKFTPKGGRVTVSADTTPREVVVHVADTGIGIPPEHHNRIFERYYQIPDQPGADEREQGHGLGLAIVRIITEGHGGTVTVRSVPGQGSTFSVHLPRS